MPRRFNFLTVIIAAIMIGAFSSAAQAQKHPRLKAPRELIDLIDPDDRSCVKQSGLDKTVTVQPIQLAADRSRQLLIKGSGLCLCGAQNCQFWIYRQTGTKFELLLKGAGSTKVRAGKQSSKGYRDIVSESHASAAETIVRTYRYDGAQYQPFSCINRAYYDDNGKYTTRPFNRPCQQ